MGALRSHSLTLTLTLSLTPTPTLTLTLTRWVLFGHTPVTGRSFPSLPQRCDLFPCDSADQDEMQCSAATRPALVLPRSLPNPAHGAARGGGADHRQGHAAGDSTCTPEADARLAPPGRWVDARKCATTFGRRHCGAGGGGATSFRGARVWLPFGCTGEARPPPSSPNPNASANPDPNPNPNPLTLTLTLGAPTSSTMRARRAALPRGPQAAGGGRLGQ